MEVPRPRTPCSEQTPAPHHHQALHWAQPGEEKGVRPWWPRRMLWGTPCAGAFCEGCLRGLRSRSHGQGGHEPVPSGSRGPQGACPQPAPSPQVQVGQRSPDLGSPAPPLPRGGSCGPCVLGHGLSRPVCPQVLRMLTLSGRRMGANWRRVSPCRPTRCRTAGPTCSAGCGTPSARAPSTAAPSSPRRGARPPGCGSPCWSRVSGPALSWAWSPPAVSPVRALGR